ncbi:MAG: bifunctional phosphoribosylaminoimidazolecarboxamide formyltransferase/IMP cyclohydrolase [Eubacteriales bacterium]
MSRAFLSVSDKTGIVEFAKGLTAAGYELLSTGGTKKVLEEAGLAVTSVSDITGFPECLDGRVKTLHPKIHAGILAMRGNTAHMQTLKDLEIEPIDIVVVNLYPFKETISNPDVVLADAIENIDIGGPTMLRAAAKNWQDVAVIIDSADYSRVLDELKSDDEVSRETKFALCAKVFEHTAAYDAMISGYLRTITEEKFPEKLTLTFEKQQVMRYGENPHQQAMFYREPLFNQGTLVDAEQLNGKELSFNNINDANGALDALREYDEITVVGAKHANPCGIGSADNVYDAYMKAYECDPVSIYGGIVVTNTTVDKKCAEEMAKIFLEIIVAPDYTDDALDVLKKKKNLRVLKLPSIKQKIKPEAMDMKKVAGGLLVQDINNILLDGDIKCVTQVKPTDAQMEDLLFAWKAVKHIKSNGILVAKDKMTLGIGPGQVSRVWAVEAALERSGEAVKGAIVASDAYFPFADSVELMAKAGIAAIIQPGGSIRDEDSIKACDAAGIAMVFTGLRHFKH